MCALRSAACSPDLSPSQTVWLILKRKEVQDCPGTEHCAQSQTDIPNVKHECLHLLSVYQLKGDTVVMDAFGTVPRQCETGTFSRA